jgi:segregation and condensation protein B
MTETGLVQIVEGALLAAGKPMTVAQLGELFEEHERPDNTDIRAALKEVAERCDDRGFELQEVASGFRYQVRQSLSPWVGRLWSERPQKYSRALLETLSLIAYRQPITRGEIEEIRGVAVSSNIIKTLHEREWIRVVGHRDVPGRPAMYATTRQFLDYFNLKNLEQLPALAEIRDFETLTAELGFTDMPAEGEGETPGLVVVGGTDHNPEGSDESTDGEEVAGSIESPESDTEAVEAAEGETAEAVDLDDAPEQEDGGDIDPTEAEITDVAQLAEAAQAVTDDSVGTDQAGDDTPSNPEGANEPERQA